MEQNVYFNTKFTNMNGWRFFETFYYCPQCGTTIAEPDIYDKSQLKCPICNEYGVKKDGFYLKLPNHYYYDNGRDFELKGLTADEQKQYPKENIITNITVIDGDIKPAAYDMLKRISSYLYRIRSASYAENADLMVEELETQQHETNLLSLELSSFGDVKKITSDIDLLTSYIKHLINIESELVSVKQRLKQLFIIDSQEKEVISAECFRKVKKIGFATPEAKEIKNNIDALNNELWSISEASKIQLKEKNNMLAELRDKRTSIEKNSKKNKHIRECDLPKKPESPIKPTMPTKPILQAEGFFNKKKVQESNNALMRQYELEMEEYNLKLEQYEIDLEKYENDMEAYHEDVKLIKEQKAQEIELQNQQAQLIYEQEAQLTKQIKEEERSFTQQKQKLQNHISELKTEYQKECQKWKDDINTYSELLLSPSDLAKKHFISDEIEKAKQVLNELIVVRDKLYSTEIVFGKYHDLIALSSFYEYLISGRCDSLKGANGAYNIYENEIRANQVISQLSSVIESLEQIKSNQYMAYSQLKAINSSLSSISSKMDTALSSLDSIKSSNETTAQYMEKVAENTEVIAYNTEVSAFYSKKNAELTDALGFMMALK